MPQKDISPIVQEFLDLLKGELKAAGQDTVKDWDALRLYTSERALHLSSLVGQPGFDQAVIAERDAIALKAALKAVNVADKADQRFLGIIQGAIVVLAKMLALGLV